MKHRVLIKLGLPVFIIVVFFMNSCASVIYEFHNELSSIPGMNSFSIDDRTNQAFNIMPNNMIVDVASAISIGKGLLYMKQSMSTEEFERSISKFDGVFSKYEESFNNPYFIGYRSYVENTVNALKVEDEESSEYSKYVNNLKEVIQVLKLELCAKMCLFCLTLIWSIISLAIMLFDYRSVKAERIMGLKGVVR